MKAMKKIVALLLALTMVLALSVPASADEKPADLTDHTYTAYQIFSGTQTTTDDTAELGNIEWGSGVDGAKLLTALQESDAFGTPNAFASCKTAKDVAVAMKDWADSSDMAKAFAKLALANKKGNGTAVVNGQTELAAGYYLVVDTTSELVDGEATNLALLQLTKKGTFEIKNKVTVPEVVKKIDEDSTKVDANDAAIGDIVNYEISSAVPATAKDYDYYYFIVNDTLSKGLDFADPMNLKVFIGGSEASGTTDYTVKTNGRNLQVALADAIAHAGEAVVITYDAVVNEGAVIGDKGNVNEVEVKYSNRPDFEYDGTNEEDNPGFPDSTKTVPVGTTPKDYTITYVTKLKIFKVDGNLKPLNGAEFTLSGTGLNKVLVFKEVFTEDNDGAYWKLTNGTYTTDEPVTADYMKEAESGATEGYVVDNNYDEEDKVVINGTTYRPVKDDETPEFVLVEKNSDLYAGTETKYKMELKSEERTAVEDEKDKTISVTAEVDANGEVTFTGLKAGTYTISETKTPAGYNTIDDITFTIDWKAPSEVKTGEEKCVWAKGTNDTSGVAYNATADAFEITIENQKGTVLPETGGIGTTIFYALGGVLLAGAAILLVTKKRMGVEE